MQDDLRIGFTLETMAAALELASQFGGVVDLAVGDQTQARILADERLLSSVKIYDSEASGREADTFVEPNAAFVRSPVGQRLRHPFEMRTKRRPAVELESARDTTHRKNSRRSEEHTSELQSQFHL